jgi:hypothetical protein
MHVKDVQGQPLEKHLKATAVSSSNAAYAAANVFPLACLA